MKTLIAACAVVWTLNLIGTAFVLLTTPKNSAVQQSRPLNNTIIFLRDA